VVKYATTVGTGVSRGIGSCWMQFALTSRVSLMSSKRLITVVRRSGKFKFIECDDPPHTIRKCDLRWGVV
jgi:hypothetical protein